MASATPDYRVFGGVVSGSTVKDLNTDLLLGEIIDRSIQRVFAYVA
jgi:phenolic acid decarboxylase